MKVEVTMSMAEVRQILIAYAIMKYHPKNVHDAILVITAKEQIIRNGTDPVLEKVVITMEQDYKHE